MYRSGYTAWLLTATSIFIALSTLALAILALYNAGFEGIKKQLSATAISQARLIEEMGRHDKLLFAESGRTESEAREATISQVVASMSTFEGFGRSGEFVLWMRSGDNISFISTQRFKEDNVPDPIPMSSTLAEPMHRVLDGESGVQIGLDYKGDRVLAAFEPISGLDIGLVAKINIAEIRGPYIRAAAVSLGGGLLMALLAVWLVLARTPLLSRLNEVEKLSEALRRSEARFRATVEQAVVGIALVSTEGRWLQANDRLCEIVGYSRDELLELSFQDITHPDDLDADQEQHSQLMAGELKSYSMEKRYIRKDGSVVWTNLSVGMVWRAPGEPDYFVSVVQDISEQKQAQAELESLNIELETIVKKRTAQLEAVNKELEAFAYSVSHDLRAPLRAVDGFSQALLEDYEDKLDEQAQDYLHRLRAGAQSMAKLIDDVLTISRVGRSPKRIQRVNLSEIAESIVAGLRQAHPQRQVEVAIEPELIAHGDEGLLSIVMGNLLENAWKFTAKRDQARIEFGRLSKDAVDGDLVPGDVTFFVRDNGAGFDMQYASRLFGAFQRLHSAAEFPGTGIGLASVQRILTRHDGHIWADGKVNAGASFYFTLGSG